MNSHYPRISMHRSALVLFLSFLLFAFAGVVRPAGAEPLLVLGEEGPVMCETVQGRAAGCLVDIVRAVMAEMGEENYIQCVPWARGIMQLESDRRTMLFPASRTPQREERFKWVGPVVRLQWWLYGRRGDSPVLRTLDDAKAVGCIGTMFEDAREVFLKSRGFTNLEGSRSTVLNVRKLLAGRLDLVAGSDLGFAIIETVEGLPPQALEPVLPFGATDLYLAFSPDVPDAEIARWDAALARIKASGRFGALYGACFSGATPPMSGQAPPVSAGAPVSP